MKQYRIDHKTEAPNSIEGIIEAAKQPTRKYNGSSKADTKAARFKLKVFFLDNPTGKTFYSYDLVKQPGEFYLHDEEEGLKKLLRMVFNWMQQGKIKAARLYATSDYYPLKTNNNYDLEILQIKYKKFKYQECTFKQRQSKKYSGFHLILDVDKINPNYFCDESPQNQESQLPTEQRLKAV